MEKIPSEFKKYGLTRQVLKTDTELRLRKYGINVAQSEEVIKQEKEEPNFLAEAKELKELKERLKNLSGPGQIKKVFKEIEKPKNPIIKAMHALYNEKSYQIFGVTVAKIFCKIEQYKERLPAIFHINVSPLTLEPLSRAAVAIMVELRKVPFYDQGHTVGWQRGCILTCGLSDLKTRIQDKVRAYVDEFINDYLAANPQNELGNKHRKNKKPTDSISSDKSSKNSPTVGEVTFIAYDKNNPVKSCAGIDGQTTRVGDTIHGVKIVRIRENKVTFEKEDNGVIVRWSQKVRGGKSKVTRSTPTMPGIGQEYSNLFDKLKTQSETLHESASGQWEFFESTTIDGWVKKIKRGSILKTTSNNIYEVSEPVIIFELELRPAVTVLTDGQFYKLIIEGIEESLICKKLNVPSKSTAISTGKTYISTGSGHWIQKNIDSGTYIKLEDNSLWEVSPIDRIYSLLWLPITDITVVEGRNPRYPYFLINTDDSEKVEARLISH